MKKKAKGFLNTLKIESVGKHILLEFWGAKGLNSIKIIKKALTQAVDTSGATLLKIELHKFSPQGISGIALIAESHISIHTCPQYQYAAIDIFTCGDKVDPYQAISSLKSTLKPKDIQLLEVKRGVLK